MSTTMAVAVYFVVWWVTLFVVLPFGVHTQDEDGEVVPGTPHSAPANMRVLRVFLINTIVATMVFVILWFALARGWVSTDMFDFSRLPPPPQ